MRAVRREKVEANESGLHLYGRRQNRGEMLLEALQRNGIQGFREARGAGGVMDVYTGNSIFGEKIYVDGRDAEQAGVIIESILAESEIDVEPEDEISDQEVKNPRWLQVSVGILLILLTAGILVSIIL